MKVALYDLQGMKKGDVELPAVFASEVREDLVLKCVEAERFGQPYGTDPRAGRRHVASGIISHSTVKAYQEFPAKYYGDAERSLIGWALNPLERVAEDDRTHQRQ